MTKHTLIAIVLALPLGAACDTPEGASVETQERAEERAEATAAEKGYGPLDQQIQGEIAEERAELAEEVNGEAEVEEPGLTAAQRIDAVEDGERDETGY